MDAAARAVVLRVTTPALQMQFNMNSRKGTKTALKGTNLCTVTISEHTIKLLLAQHGVETSFPMTESK